MDENKKGNHDILTGVVIGVAVTVFIMVLFSLVMDFSSKYLGIGNRVLSQEEKMEEISELIEDNFALEYDADELVESQYAGYVYGLQDPYSAYLTEENYDKMMESTNGEYVGIGVGVTPQTERNTILITQVFTNSPAEAAGLMMGDEIVAVEGETVTGTEMDQAIIQIKGKPKTSVVITIRDGKTGKNRDVTLIRDYVTVDTVFYEKFETNIGYIRISSFDAVTDEQFEEAYKKLIEDGVEGLILDLRNNPGGLLSVVTNIADLLVPEGNIVYTEDVNGKKEYAVSDDTKIEIPLQVLVNGYSASASEVLAGAIKDYGVGELVGETTFGKGIVQRIFPLGDGSAVKLTISKYFTPSGVCINGIGIEPDYEVVMEDEVYINLFRNFDRNYDTQLKKALENIKAQIN